MPSKGHRELVFGFLLLAAPLWSQAVAVSGHVVVDHLAAAKDAQSLDNSNVVIWLTPVERNLATQARQSQPQVRLIQKDKRFIPALLVVPVGTKVEFPNQDPFFHNVFSLFDGRRFDLGLYEAGTSRSVSFDRSGVSYIFCNIHPEMHAVVVSPDTPFFAVSNAAGVVSIPEVPAGKYTLHVWYERATTEALGMLSQPITISEQHAAVPLIRVAETLQLRAEHKNKFGKDYDRSSRERIY